MALAQRGGGVLVDTDAVRRERVTVGGRLATGDELAAYGAAWEAMDGLAAEALGAEALGGGGGSEPGGGDGGRGVRGRR